MITKNDVQKIAGLARIHLEGQELENLTKNLEGILGYVDQLKKLNVDNVEPTSHVLPLHNVYREDIVKPSLNTEDSLKNAPQKEGKAFKVPQVIE